PNLSVYLPGPHLCQNELCVASLCVPLPLLLSPWRHTLSMGFSLCLSPSLPKGAVCAFSLFPSAPPTLPVETHTEYGFLFVSLSHSPTLPFSPSILLSLSPSLSPCIYIQYISRQKEGKGPVLSYSIKTQM